MIKIATFYDSVFPHKQAELWLLDDWMTYRLEIQEGPYIVDSKSFIGLDQALKYTRQTYLHDAY